MIKKHLYQILLVLLLFSLLSVVYLPIRRNIVGQLEKVKISLISGWEKEYELQVKYRSISPTIINSLRIREFFLRGDRGISFTFTSDRISIFYGLKLFTREKSRINLRRIVIRGGTLDLTLPEGEGSDKNLDSEEIMEQARSVLARYFPEGIIELRDVDVKIKTAGETVNWNISLLKLDKNDEVISVNHRGYCRLSDDIAFSLNGRGTLSSSLDSLNISLGIEDFLSPYILFDKFDFQVSLKDESIRISKINDKFPLDISLERERGLWEIQYQSEDFRPSLMFSPGSDWDIYSDWFDADIDGSFSCAYDPETGEINYMTKIRVGASTPEIRQYLGGYSSLTANSSGTGWDVYCDNLSLSSPAGIFSYRGDLHLIEKTAGGRFYMSRVKLPNGESLQAFWTIDLADDGDFSMESYRLSINGREGGELILNGEARWDDKSFFLNTMYRGEMAESFTLDVFGEQRRDKWNLKGWYEIEDMDIPALMAFTGMTGGENDISRVLKDGLVDSRGFIEKSGDRESVRVDSFSLDGLDYRFAFSGFGNREEIILSDISFTSSQHQLRGSLQGKMSDIAIISTRLVHNGNSYDLSLEWDREKGIADVSGNHGLKGRFTFFDSDMVYLDFSTDGLPLEFGDNKLLASLNLSGMISPERRSIAFYDNRIVLEKNPFLGPTDIRVSGNLDNGNLHINNILWKDDLSVISGNGKLLLPYAGSDQFNGWLTLNSEDDEKYKFLFFRDQDSYSGYGEIENFIAERIALIEKEGKISAKLNFSSIPDNPRVKGNIDASFEEGGRITGFVDMDEKRILLTGLTGSRGESGFDSGLVSINRSTGELMVSLGVYGKVAKKDWTSGLYLKGQSRDLLNAEEADFSGTLITEEIIFGGNTVCPALSFNMERSGEYLSLYNEDRRVWNSYYNLQNGEIIASSESLLPVSFDLRGMITAEEMDLTISEIDMDMRKANPFMPVDFASRKAMVEFVQGTLRGYLSLQGTPETPEINGVMTIDPLQLNTAYSTKEKGLTRAAVDITSNNITIPYFEMAVGKTGTIGAKGSILLNGWSPDEFSFDFFLKGRNGGSVAMIYPIKGLALNGEAEGNVSFYGAGDQYFIKGELLMDKLLMSLAQTPQKPKIPKSERIDPWDLKVDLSFITGKDVSIVVPNEDFHVVKAQLDIDQKLRYQLDNIPWVFSLTGDMEIRTGEIDYFDKTFDLTEGHVAFDENEEGFDPMLDITAETSVTNQTEDVTLIISYAGSLFSDFDPQFSSIPAYSEREILAMLEPFQDGDNSSLALALGSYADKYTFSAPFEEGLKDALNVDMVTIETGFLKNIIEDQLNSGQGVYTNESSQYNVARYLDGTFLNVGKYLGRDLFVAGGISVDYDEQRTAMSGMGLDFNIKLEMETPFFNIGWTYLPDDLDSRSSSEGFISDSSITINFRL